MSSSEPFQALDLVRDASRIPDLQSQLLLRTASRVHRLHAHYREVMTQHGVDPAELKDLESLTNLPLTQKAEFVDDPERFRLRPDPGAPGEYVLWDVAYTTGTSTGRPTPMYQTAYDFRALMIAQRRMAEIRGMTSRDRIVNLYPLTPLPHGAWLRCNQAAAAIGASVTHTMSGRQVGEFPITRTTEEVTQLTVAANPTVLWGVPSYVRQILQEVRTDGGGLPSLRMAAVSGEPCGEGMRRSIVDLAAAVGASESFSVSDSLGATELQCGLVECVPGTGFHNPAPELFHLAAVDDNGAPVGPGSDGHLVLTHLDRRGTVLLRFLLGDKVVLTDEPCPNCGRGGGRITRHKGRSGRFTKVRGNLVDLHSLSNAIAGVRDVVEHQLEIRRRADDSLGLDELVVRIVLGGSSDATTTSAEVARAVGVAASMKATVEVVDLRDIWATGADMKPPRVVDNRAET